MCIRDSSKTTRESLKYDGDYYWEYTNAYVNGVKQSVYVDQDLGALEVGHLYKATKTVDEKYITCLLYTSRDRGEGDLLF